MSVKFQQVRTSDKILDDIQRNIGAAIDGATDATIVEYTGAGASETLSVLSELVIYANHGTGLLTVTAAAGETINGAASLYIPPQSTAVVARITSGAHVALSTGFGATIDPANAGVAAAMPPEDAARPMMFAARDSVTFSASAASGNSYAARQLAYTIDHAGHNLPVAAFGLRIMAIETDVTGLGGNHLPLSVKVNGTTIFSVSAAVGAVPSITSVKRMVVGDTLTVGGTIALVNGAAVTIAAANGVTLGGAGQKTAVNGNAPVAQQAAVADPTDLATVIARFKELRDAVKTFGITA